MSRTTIPTAAKIAAYTAAAMSVGGCCALLLVQGLDGWALALSMLAITIAAGRLHGRLSFYATVSPDDLPLAASILLLEPRFAIVVGVVSGILAKARFGLVSRALNLVVMAVPVGLACLGFNLATASLGVSGPQDGALTWFVLGVIAVLTMSLVHYLLHTAWSHSAHGIEFFRTVAVPLLRGDALGAVMVTSLVEIGYLLPGSSRALPGLVAAFGFIGVWLFLRSSQRQIEAANHRDSLNTAIFVSLARLLEMRDPDTAIHSARVAIFSRDIATAMGLSVEEQSRIHLAGLLHDVGKVGVPDGVLLKPGRLSDDERLAMERHARLSAEALAGIPGFGDLARMVYAHHERLDGSGYPEGVQGDELPLGARILGVADTFEAITAVRPYRASRSRATALEILADEKHLFDQEVVDALQKALKTGTASESGNEDLSEFAKEWSRAGRHMLAHLDEEPFVVPAERPREASKVPPSAQPDNSDKLAGQPGSQIVAV